MMCDIFYGEIDFTCMQAVDKRCWLRTAAKYHIYYYDISYYIIFQYLILGGKAQFCAEASAGRVQTTAAGHPAEELGGNKESRPCRV